MSHNGLYRKLNEMQFEFGGATAGKAAALLNSPMHWSLNSRSDESSQRFEQPGYRSSRSRLSFVSSTAGIIREQICKNSFELFGQLSFHSQV